jgi:hypothetical protein
MKPIYGQQKFRWVVETGLQPKSGAQQPNDEAQRLPETAREQRGGGSDV